MEKKRYRIIEEEDGVVIYDESDDYVPEENILDEDDELDTDYILRDAKRQEEQEAKEKRQQRLVSSGVIAAVVAFIAIISYINFKGIL